MFESDAPHAAERFAPTDKRLVMFSRVLEHAYEGAASGDESHWSARVTIRQDAAVRTAAQAATAAERYVRDAAGQVGLPDWPITQTDVIPEMLGSKDAAALLGVSRQRLHELRSSGRFPVPAAELGNSPVWLRSALDDFIARWRRQPGPRPTRSVPYVASDGTTHHLTATGDERAGTVWVPVSLAATSPLIRSAWGRTRRSSHIPSM